MHYPIPPDPPPGCPECGDDIVEVGDHVRCEYCEWSIHKENY